MFDRSEVESLLHKYQCNSINDTEAARLENLLIESEEVRRFVSRSLIAESLLRTELQVSEVSRMFAGNNAMATFDRYPSEALPLSSLPATPHSPTTPTYSQRRTTADQTWSRFYAGALLACLLVGLGMWNLLLLVEVRSARNPTPAAVAPSTSTARLVTSTLCLWDVRSRPLAHDQRIAPNTSLRLLEGIAAIQLQGQEVGDAMLRIEGPAGWVVSSDGQPSLHYGKMTVDATGRGGTLWVDTPVGKIRFADPASVGIVCFGNELEVHVFSGSVQVDSVWSVDGDEVSPLYLVADEMVRLRIAEAAPSSESYAKADPSRFASRLSMASDDLRLGDEYAEAVKQLQPVGYWRFDSVEGGVVQNEMGPEFPLRVVGEVKVRGTPENRYLEFIDEITPECLNAALLTDEPFVGKFVDGCSVELWIKPSHFHLASLVSLVKGPISPEGRANHGILLEIGGPHPLRGGLRHPGSIRFTNRYPAAQVPVLKESTYTDDTYKLRRWQHVVAVKSDNERRVYIDGELAATTPEGRPMADELTLLVGRLHAQLAERRFVGQLDELAIYSRALTAEEVKSHFERVRPVPSEPPGI